jgi:hypothetical protein
MERAFPTDTETGCTEVYWQPARKQRFLLKNGIT